jgi:hypothetical protein
MSPRTPDRIDESRRDRPPFEPREASGGMGLGVTAIFMLVFLAVVVGVVVFA